jgi:hypothetical protein
VHDAQGAAPARAGVVLGGWDRLRLGLLAAQLLVLVMTAAVGHRETPLADLEAAVGQGQVDSVEIVGETPSGGQGYGIQAVRWRDGPIRRTAEALVGARPDAGAVDLPWRDADLGVVLSRADPDLEVRRGEQGYPSSHGELLGWRVPTWTALPAVTALLLNVGFLLCVPRTWRATRWAWFWVMTVPVVGTVLMLLLSGPAPGLPAPKARARRLTGGWAFILSTVVVGMLSRPGTAGGA